MNYPFKEEILRRSQIISKSTDCIDFLNRLKKANNGAGFLLTDQELTAKSAKEQLHISRFIEQHRLDEKGYSLNKVKQGTQAHYLEFLNELPFSKHSNSRGCSHVSALTSVLTTQHGSFINLHIGVSTEINPKTNLVFSATVQPGAHATIAKSELQQYQAVLFSYTYAVTTAAAAGVINHV